MSCILLNFVKLTVAQQHYLSIIFKDFYLSGKNNVKNCHNFIYAHEQSIIYEKQQCCLGPLYWFPSCCVISEVLMHTVNTFQILVTLYYMVLFIYILIGFSIPVSSFVCVCVCVWCVCVCVCVCVVLTTCTNLLSYHIGIIVPLFHLKGD